MHTSHITFKCYTDIIMKNGNNMKPATKKVTGDEIHVEWDSDSFTGAEVILPRLTHFHTVLITTYISYWCLD